MRREIKTVGAALLTAVMVFGSALGVFAATPTGGIVGEPYTSQNEGAIAENTITIAKDIVIYNTTASTDVHNPNITYNYTITPAGVTDKAYTVTDGDSDVGNVYNGVADAITGSATVTYTAADVTTAGPDGALAHKTFTLTVDPSKFTHAGIYRYKISEADNSAARTAAGVARTSEYNEDLYLDVYVRKDVNDENANSDYVVYGYVLFENKTDGNFNVDTTTTGKTDGYVATPVSGTYTTASDVDYYNTYNLKVVKEVSGSLADAHENFPFQIAMSNAAITAQPKVDVSSTSTHGATSGQTKADGTQTFAADGTLTLGAGAAASTVTLADGKFILITGIPAEITSVVTEYNSSYDVYKPNITDTAVTGGTAAYTSANVQPEATAVITAVTGTNDVDDNALTAGDLVLTVTNEIQIVSPTGLALRFAPFAMIAAAALAALIILRKRVSASATQD